jgi:hypothetical protein
VMTSEGANFQKCTDIWAERLSDLSCNKITLSLLRTEIQEAPSSARRHILLASKAETRPCAIRSVIQSERREKHNRTYSRKTARRITKS